MSKIYSPSEISLHTSKKDCWLIIHGKVYDVTSFLEDHPGGDDALLHASASGDATESFEDVGHSSTAASMMESYLIGSVEGHAKAGMPPAAPNSIQKSAAGAAAAAAAAAGAASSPSSSSFLLDVLLPLIVLAVAFAAWYYLTFQANNANKTGHQDL